MDLVKIQTSGKNALLLDSLSKNCNQGKRLAIYGLGAVAKMLIDVLRDRNIMGLMDKDPANIGKQIYGHKVLSIAEVIDTVDTIIIAASEVYWQTIYSRIAFLKECHGKNILYSDGTPASADTYDGTIHDNPYWSVSAEQIRKEIDRHSVISFDIFDTLLCRKLARPDDILDEVSERAKALLPATLNFIHVRKEAEEHCRKAITPDFSIDQLYQIMVKLFPISEDTAYRLKQLEIDTETDSVLPRNEVISLFQYAVQKNKRIFLVSDFHLPSSILRNMLQNADLSLDQAALIVSCEHGKSKKEGNLWAAYRQIIGKTCALHIGDNDVADISNPRSFGITGTKVMGCGEMLLSSSLRDLTEHCLTVQDSKVLGLIQSNLFNCPFTLSKHKGIPEVTDPFSFGYVFLGPLLYSYFAWLINELEQEKFDKVLFLAREGYLLENIYRKIVNKLNFIKTLPSAIYFRTSRRMASVASLKTDEDIYQTLKDSFSGNVGELLKNRFGINIAKNISKEKIVNSDPKVREILSRHISAILQNAAEERRCYINYMRSIGLQETNRLAIADIGMKGSIQNYLGKFFSAEYVGFYITALTGAANPYGLGESIRAFFPEDPMKPKTASNAFKYHILFESSLVAPEGMYIRALADGKFVNASGFGNQRFYAKKEEIHRGIEAFIFEMLAMNDNKLRELPSKKLVDQIYGLPMSSKIKMSDELKSSFFVDELFGVVSEKKIWE